MKRIILLSLLIICGITMAIVPINAAKVETISLWAMGLEGNTIGKVIPKFEAANPGIKVRLQVIPWGAANDRFVTAVAGGTVPDVAQMGSTWMPQFFAAGALEDLSTYINKSKTLKMSNFFDACVNLCKYDGKYYGIPWYADTRFIFYRTDILAEVGYKTFPDTWEEFLDCCRKLHARGPKLHAFSFSSSNWQEFMNFIWANNGRIFDEKGYPAVTEPAFVEAVEWVANLFWEDLSLLDSGGTNIRQDLATGRLPIFSGGFWEANLIQTEVPQINGKWAMALMPKKKSRASFMGGCELVIFKESRRKEAAWKFIDFLSRAEIQNEWRRTAGSIPANKEALELAAKDDSLMKIVYEQLKEAVAPPTIPEWEQIASRLNTRVQEVCYRKKTALEACRLLEDDIKRIMRIK